MNDQEQYEKIKAAALEFLFSGPEPEARDTVKTFLGNLESKIEDAAAADRQIDAIIAKLQGATPDAPIAGTKTLFDRLGEAMQSPPFYFFFGCLMLIAAFVCTEVRYNSSLTFLIAMLGVAIMLYGTGSQAAGTFGAGNPSASALLARSKGPVNGKEPVQPDDGAPPEPSQIGVPNASTPRISAPMNVAIAGGAAVLSAFFGWSVLTYAPGIRQVFRDDDQYTIVKVELCDSSVSTCRDPSFGTNRSRDELGKTSLVPPQAMDQLLKEAYLETSFGHRAYARKDGKILEFIVFDRDLTDGDDVRLMANAVVESRTYLVDESFFDLKSDQACLTKQGQPVSGTGGACEAGVFKLSQDARDPDRVRWLVLRAPVIRAANELAVQGGTLETRPPSNPIAPL